jgi:hypothetical protein
MVKIYDMGTDSLIELTQERFDQIEKMGISDSKRKALIKIICNLPREEFDNKFDKLYDTVVPSPIGFQKN